MKGGAVDLSIGRHYNSKMPIRVEKQSREQQAVRRKLKVCFIPSKLLPVPSVKGGAIESILTDIAEQNERLGLLDITIISVYDRQAVAAAKRYNRTNIIFVKDNLWRKLFVVYYRVTNRLFGLHRLAYNEAVLRKIRRMEFDYIIVEGGAEDYFLSYHRYFNKEKMIYHLHYNGTTTPLMEATFSKMIGVSDFVVNDFKKSSNIPHCDVIHNGVNKDKFAMRATPEDRIAIRRSLGFSDHDFIVMYVGRIVPVKGVLELIDAVHNVADQRVKLMVVGSTSFASGEISAYEKQVAERTAHSSRVVMTGFIDNTELYKYQGAADVQVIPSIWEEAFGLVAIEGMLAKLPIIASDSGGLREVVNGYGIIVPRGDRFSEGLRDAIESVKQGLSRVDVQVAYNYATSFSAEQMYRNLVQLLESYDR